MLAVRSVALAAVYAAFLLCGCGTPGKGSSSNPRLTPGTASVRSQRPPPVVSPVQGQAVVVPIPQVVPPPPPQQRPVRPSPRPPIAVQPAPAAPAPAPAPAPAFRPQWVALPTWAAQAGLSAPVRVGKDAFQIQSAAGAFQLTVGTRTANWNGVKFHLGFAPVATNGVPFIHALDADKNLAPLTQANRPVPRGRGVIVLDPGHGGPDSGTKSVLGNFFEKDYALDWARRLKPLLEARGWRVVLTRDTNRPVELGERVLVAQREQADLFISLHFNSAAPGAMGLETFCLTPAGMPSTLLRGPEENNVFLPNNAQDFGNQHLALRVQRSLLQTAGMPDRGVRRARFMAVLKTQQRPAILIEGGYITDRNEAKLIASPEYRQKLALGVAKALE